VALILAPASIVSGQELKPKFGDIGGVYYTEVSQDREACQQAIKNKIALCRQNTSFVSNTLDRKYPGCLPIFRSQSQVCKDHFRSEAYKCQGSGSVRIEDFTGFACTVTATVVEEDGEPERTSGIAPVDRPAPQDHGLSEKREEIAAVEAQIESAERDVDAALAKYAAIDRSRDNYAMSWLIEQAFGSRDLAAVAAGPELVPLCVAMLGRSEATCLSQYEQLERALQSRRSALQAVDAELKLADEQIDRAQRHLRALQKHHNDLLNNGR